MPNKTFTTYNYNRFKLVNDNRPIDERHVAKLMRSIKKYGLLVPILCDKQDNIVDGQHRYEACKRGGYELAVQVRQSISTEKIIEINSTGKTWTLIDYANHYASLGYEDYVDFIRLVDDYPQVGKMSIAMACAGEQINTNPFKTGKLVCVNMQQTREMLHLMHAARLHGLKCKMHHVAIMRYVQKGYSVQDMIDRLAIVHDNMKVVKPRNIKDALRIWQDIYNWKRRHNTIML